MIRLIKNEFIKIFHRKSCWLTVIVMFGFLILTTYISSRDFTKNYEQLENDSIRQNIEYSQEAINSLNKNNGGYYEDLISLSSDIEYSKLLLEYDYYSWQRDYIRNNYQELIQEYYTEVYIKNDKTKIESLERKINEFKSQLANLSWQEYIEYLKNENSKSIAEIKQINIDRLSEIKRQEIKNSLEYLEYLNKLYDYRLDNNVSYAKSFLNDAINDLISVKSIQIELKNSTHLDEDKQAQFDTINAQVSRNEYVLEHKADVNNTHSLKSLFEDFFYSNEILIVVFLVLISGSIVSDEFQKGTIKSLLITPFSRVKIILAKYISVLLLIPFITLILIIFECLIGGIAFGFSSLSLPMIVYNYSLHNIEVLSIVHYLLIYFAAYLPYFIMISTISFALSTIIINNGFAIAITLFGVIGSSILNSLASVYNFYLLRYYISLNWDFAAYLFGASPAYKYVDLKFSIIVYLIYLITILSATIIVFKKRNIKNI